MKIWQLATAEAASKCESFGCLHPATQVAIVIAVAIVLCVMFIAL